MPPKRKYNSTVSDDTGHPSSSQGPVHSSSSTHPYGEPSAKKGRKAEGANPAASAPEKRGARVRSSCPKAIMDRVDRVMSQRFFMVDRRRDADELREEFSVLGSTGNVYTVAIDKVPTCNCPDALKGNHCKHILFIYFKVLHVPQTSNAWYQKALLKSELSAIFASAPAAPAASTAAPVGVRTAYARAIGTAGASDGDGADDEGAAKRREPGPEDDCPVCYEHLAGTAQLAWCATCGNALHRECFAQWAGAAGGRAVTCVYCRSPWADHGAAGAGPGAGRSDGYVNLAGAAGLSPVRDSSSYYNGPRRGERYYRKYW